MYSIHVFRTSSVKLLLLAVSIMVFASIAQPVVAVIVVPVGDPFPTLPTGPGIPYISGRLGPVQTSSDPPIGEVVPDDFCLPGKFEDCGEHLRDAVDFAPVAQQDGPIFVGRENLAFSRAKQSVWISGQSRQTELGASLEDRSLTSFSAGVDRRFGDNFILGVMVVSNDQTSTFGAGFIDDIETGTLLVGPYFAFRLSDTLVLDGRYVLGKSDHTVISGGTVSGEFQSSDSFAALRLSATFDRSNWRLHPSLELAMTKQDKDAYDDLVRGPIAAETNNDTFVTAAMLAYYQGLSLGNGNFVPYFGAEITSSDSDSGSIFGTLRTGMALTMGNGAVLNFDYAYGAIGLSEVDDQLISLRLEIPL